jgi:putative oxidoreductase
MNNTVILRFAVAIILLTHSIPGMFNNGVNDFGNLYLNQIGFAPVGVYLAWLIKISHVLCAVLLLLNRFIKPAAIITIFILIMGIVLVHFKEGWFVVGGGRNGVEYNFLLICVLVAIMFPEWLEKSGLIHIHIQFVS